jgi:hypothetical protein
MMWFIIIIIIIIAAAAAADAASSEWDAMYMGSVIAAPLATMDTFATLKATEKEVHT